MFAFRYAYYKHAKLMNENFENHVILLVHGDDNNSAYSDYAKEYMTPKYIKEMFKEIGLEVTSSDKKNFEDTEFRRIEDMSFLKRTWRYEPLLNRHIAPMQLDAVLEICLWKKKKSGEIEQLDAIDEVIRELSYHKEDYDKYASWLSQITKDHFTDVSHSRDRKSVV